MNVAVMDNAAKLRALAERVAASAPAERLALVERLRTADLSLGDLPVPRADRTRPLPASDLQRRLWILWRLDPASAAYAVGGGLRLRGRLDASALRRAFDAAATRHEILRTRFCEDAGGTLSQIVDPPGPCDFAQADLAAAADPEAALAQAARETIEAPFDLEKGPLLRLRLLRLGEDDHALVMALHHAVCDGWSLEILGREVSEAYAAFAGGHAFEAPVPSIQFADWAAWRAARLEAGEFEDAIARSVARLEGFPRAAALGGFVDENAEPDGRALRLPLAFSPEAGAGAQALARALGTTGFSVSLAIFCAFLRRIAGQSRFIVGAPAANREGAAAQDVLGAFVNTLALPIEVDAGASLRSLVTAVDAAVRTAQEGQEAPFERVVEALGGGPPFNVMFAYQRAAPPPVFAGLAATPIEALPEAAKFDLAFGVEEGEGGALAGMLVFARARFSRESAARLRGRLLRFFEEAALRPDAPLVDLDMLPPAERGLLARWGAPRRAPAFVSAAQLISALSSSAPFRPALVGSGFRLNYGELASVSNGVAVALARLGAGREARVALVFGRTPLAIVAMLGALKAGAAYVPLDPDAPAERNAAMIADAGASVLVCEDGDRRADALAPGLPRLRLDPASLPSAAEAPQVEAHPDQLAYVVFTSGSTGRPKGVGVAHGPLAMHAREVGALYGANPDDVVLHVISFSFDGATECWLAALAHGGRLVVADPKSLAPADLLALVRREGVTIVGMTPALLMSLVEAQDGEGGGPLPVRSWTAGGEAFALKDFARLRAAFPSARIINGYGPTEAVITPTLFAAAPDAPAARYASPAGEAGFVPIGTPVGARAAHVLDEDMNEVGVGVAGELHLGGYGLARGYLGRPGETALRFVPDPFGPRGARLYRTGDRVRRREDGGLDYLGRLDRQAKIRGFRIEPGEVEAQLVADPLCREAAAVVARRAGAPQLVAYVAPARTPVAQALDAATLASRLRTRLEARLPDYMRPSLIEVLPALPRLPNGKIDRLALPEPAWPHTAYEPPRTETERALAAIWESLLDARPIGRAQSFLELGGNSITAIKMTAGIRDLATFNTWMNLDSVAHFWDQKGSRDEHRAYLESMAADPHMTSMVGCFDDEPFAYFEVYWAKEDRIAPFYDVDDFDRGVHLLVGDSKHQGPGKVEAWFRGLLHYMFLDEPRTRRIVGDPRVDHVRWIEYMEKQGFLRLREFDLPHKRSELVLIERETFFGEPWGGPR
ncbi:amino acid adenylation domain-containing protein [Methylocella sp.]|uniref:amino acid adenylation domain-containing protein n=1 Tax=Methylocella sp. TaxID=1978226 RepID=UPI00378393E7